jgi:hypothetical protein
MMFTDARFMTAADKERVLKDWERFLERGLQQGHFTKRLYEHLHLHCGFIAHYNIHGFFAEYFQAGQDTERFFENFCSSTSIDRAMRCGEYDDLHKAMGEVLAQHQTRITQQIEQDVSRRIELLDAAVQQAKADRGFAKQLLGKIGF